MSDTTQIVDGTIYSYGHVYLLRKDGKNHALPFAASREDKVYGAVVIGWLPLELTV